MRDQGQFPGHVNPVREKGNSSDQVASAQSGLPRGGGSIRGLNEKISVDAFTGAASLTVALLELPEGRFQRSLVPKLVYSSSGGNGPFGIGWSVDAPSVTRRTDKGVPYYDDRDTFVLSGADHLVPVANVERQGWHVTTFRPRIEKDFALVERWRLLSNDTRVFWRVVSRDNVTSLYGYNSKGLLHHPEQPAQHFQWRLQLQYDDRGNAVRIEHAQDTGVFQDNPFIAIYPLFWQVGTLDVGIPPSSDVTPWLNALDRVHAGNDFSPRFELQFDYGAPVSPEHQPVDLSTYESNNVPRRIVGPGAWEERQDGFGSWRSGFQQRTQRLCRRVVLLHRFLGEVDDLVRSFELHYNENPYVTKLAAVTQVSYRRPLATEVPTADDLIARAFPPLELTYAGSIIPGGAQIQSADMEGFPGANALERAEWIDIDGEGAPGLLHRFASDEWQFARNRGRGRMASPAPCGSDRRMPVGAAAQLLDLSGDGAVDLVSLEAGAGFYSERNEENTWSAARQFESLPNVDFSDPNGRMSDLDGDGLADLLVTENDSLALYQSLGKRGFGPKQSVAWDTNENRAPRMLFNDPLQSVYLADMSGDGLTDLVRIRNGEVCYWPGRGRGRFASRVTMRNPPLFAPSELFDPRRIRFADIDGSGTTDLLYLGAAGVTCWRNRAGTDWSDAEVIPFVAVHDPAAFSVIDLLGNGTSCLVWTGNDPAQQRRPIKYVHLAASGRATIGPPQKPHLLTQVTNNIGGEIHLTFTSSAEFAAADRDAMRPWITKLGFPVQVVSQIKRVDRITGREHFTAYAYHHGFFDAEEREFRGFACVDERDTVSFAELSAPNATADFAKAFHVPPVLKKTWFHTGASFHKTSQVQRLQAEYFQGDPDAVLLPDTQFAELLCGDELRQAHRALMGSVLREELYSEEGPSCAKSQPSARPYSVSERSYRVRRLVPEANDRRAVFFVHPEQQLDFHYERQLEDPRITHRFTLAVDEWGNVMRSADVAYGRRETGIARDADFLTDTEADIQRRTFVSLTDRQHTNAIDSLADGQRHTPLPSEESTWELTGLDQVTSKFFSAEDFNDVLSDNRTISVFHDAESMAADLARQGKPARRLIECLQQHYADHTGINSLPLGQLRLPALPHRSFKLALDRIPDQLRSRAQRSGQDPATLLAAARYVQVGADLDAWWAPQPYRNYDATRPAPAAPASFVPIEQIDAFGNVTRLEYDRWKMFKSAVTQPLGNRTSWTHDYRVLQPRKLVDINGGVTRLSYDTLGLVVATAVEGRSNQSGDRLSSNQSYELTAAELADFINDPAAQSTALLGDATTRSVYDPLAFYRWLRSGSGVDPMPVWSASLARQRHRNQTGGASSPVELAIVYTNGFSEEGQSVRQTGLTGSRRWLLSGKRELNNKSKPVREYEPFYADSHQYSPKRHGVAKTLFYDPLSRVTGVLHPDHSWEKTRFGAWSQEIWDRNDTALLDPQTDQQLGGFFGRLDDKDYQPSWHHQLELSARDADASRARVLSSIQKQVAAHAGTPERVFLDPLGHAFLKIADNRVTAVGENSPDSADPATPVHMELFHTRTEFDIEGNRRQTVDAAGRAIVRTKFNLLGTPWLTEQADWKRRDDPSLPGQLLTIPFTDGKIAFSWDEQDRFIEHRYDELRRPTTTLVNGVLVEQHVYGESLAGAESRYQRGQRVSETVANDGGAGSVTTRFLLYDWNGNLVHEERSSGVGTLQVQTEYDATDQILHKLHDGRVHEWHYRDLLGRLVQVSARNGNSGAVHWPIRSVEYNARGQRVSMIQYQTEQLTTDYEYDPLTHRLEHNRSFAGTSVWQHLETVYDAAGNVCYIYDHASGREFLKDDHASVKGHQRFEYDATYRLVAATGREHPGQLNDGAPAKDIAWANQPHPNDHQQLTSYRREYVYDSVGNLIEQRHIGAANWTRQFEFAPSRNHLLQTNVGAAVVDRLAYDNHGNTISSNHLARLHWDHEGHLLKAVGGVSGEARYSYDADGNRAIKLESNSQRVYLGDTEDDGGRLSISIRDSAGQRVAKLQLDGAAVLLLSILSDHLGSSRVEASESGGRLICESFEECYPYGESSFGWSRRRKRYRWSGKERDALTGFYYFGARYFVSWQGNWLSADPSGIDDGANRYRYAHSNPMTEVDADGRAASNFADNAKAFATGAGKAVLGAVAGVVAVGAIAAGGAALAAAVPVLATAIALTGVVAAGGAVVYGAVVTAKAGYEVATATSWDTGKHLSSTQRSEMAGELAVGAIPGLAALTKSGRTAVNAGTRAVGGVMKSAVDLGAKTGSKVKGLGAKLVSKLKAPESARQTGAGSSSGAADAAYSLIRASTNDVGEIASNTGLKPSSVQKVKDHLFFNEHFLDRYESIGEPGYMSRFDSDAGIATAWNRLQTGTHGSADMQLLRHEAAEAWFMRKYGPSYNAAHEAAQRRFPAPNLGGN